MKKITLILIAILFISGMSHLSSQNQIQLADISLINLGDGQYFGHKQDDEKTPLQGKFRIITGYTTEYIDAEFSDGLAIGKWEYYRNNNLLSYVSYNKGYKDGEYAEMTAGGTPKLTGNYKNGKKDGNWDTYNMDGDVKEREVFENDDLRKRISYYTNGNISSERSYLNKKEHGISKTYEQDGTLKSEKNYVNNKQVGKQMQFYYSNNHNFIATSNYSDKGKQDGEYLEVYAENKQTKTKGQYVNGLKEGKWQYYTLGGTLEKEDIYEKDVKKSSIIHHK